MTTALRDWTATTWVAATALALALVVDIGLLIPRGAMEDAALLALPSPTPIRAPAIDDHEAVREAANRAPFGATKASVALPASNATFQNTAPLPVLRPRLLGTVVEHDGGFVVVEMPDARLQVVRIGERAGDMRLRSVAPGEAVFDDPRDGRITLRTSQPGRPDTRP